MKKFTQVAVLIVSAFAVFACGSSAPAVKVIPRNTPVFDYKAPTQSGIASNNMTIALIKPVFIKEDPNILVSPFPEMSLRMGNDFEELLAAKGFTMRGPFNTRDEMVFTEKVNSSFILEIAIDISPEQTVNIKKVGSIKQGLLADVLIGPQAPTSVYRASGQITFGGYLVLTALSPQYGEKIWKKSIAIEKTTFNYEGSINWAGKPNMAKQLVMDNAVYNAVVSQLEACYVKWLDIVWRQIDPEEMKIVAKQAKEADKRTN